MTKTLSKLVLLAMLFPTLALAEPIGRWFGDSSQGSPIYGITKDGSGFDSLQIVCGAGEARLRVTVGSARPKPGDMVKFIVDGNEWAMFANDDREVTPSAQSGASFAGLWNALRRGQALRVRLASGGTSVYTLRGAAKALPPQPCGSI